MHTLSLYLYDKVIKYIFRILIDISKNPRIKKFASIKQLSPLFSIWVEICNFLLNVKTLEKLAAINP